MIVLLLVFLLMPVSSWAQLSSEQALSVRQVQEPKFSPDGTRVAFTFSLFSSSSVSDAFRCRRTAN